MSDEELQRLKVAETLSGLKVADLQKGNEGLPSWGKSKGKKKRVPLTLEEEKAKLEQLKTKFKGAVSKYRDVAYTKWNADKKNLDSYMTVNRARAAGPGLQEECRTQQTKNKAVKEEGMKRVEVIEGKTKDLKEGVFKNIKSVEESIEKDEQLLREKEKEWHELSDNLESMKRHRELQLKQKEAIGNATALQKQIGSAHEEQRQHALTQLNRRRELQTLRLEEKRAKLQEYEEILGSLEERKAGVRKHLDDNVPVLESCKYHTRT
jgi:hypothetical protein